MPREFANEVIQRAVPEWGALANDVNFKTIPLDNARSAKELHVGGNFFKVVAASSLSASASINLNQFSLPDNGGLPIRKGAGFRGVAYNSVYLTNTAQAGEWLTIAFVREEFSAGFEVFDEIADFTEVTLDIGNNLSDADEQSIAVNTTDSIAANASRRKLHIQASPANTDYLRVSPAASETRGTWLGPGAIYTIENTDLVQVRNMTTGTGFSGTTAATQTYYYWEEED